MKKWLNGNIVDMTAEEIAELEDHGEEAKEGEEIAELEKMQSEAPAPTPTIEERVEKVEVDTKVIRAILMGEETSE